MGAITAAIMAMGSWTVGAQDAGGGAEVGAVGWVFFGTYSGEGSRGIYRARFDGGSGELGEAVLAAESEHPSFLAIHPGGGFLYAVNETVEFGGERSGSVTAFALDRAAGTLRKLNQVSSGGAAPCHIEMDRQGGHVLIANYAGGSVAAIALGEDGRLGERTAFVQHEGSSVNARRQEAPHAHCIRIDASGGYAVAADLGLDRVLVYRFDSETGALLANDPPGSTVEPGSGPRHFAFRGDAKFGYVINELRSTVTAFSWNVEDGVLEPVQTISTLPPDFRGTSHTAEVVVSPDNRFVYGSNRGHDSIAVFRSDPESGRLTLVEIEATRGKTPRNFALHPGGGWLLAANQGSDTVTVFRVDAETGALEPRGGEVGVPRPVCVRFVPMAED
ncbi:MAG TPA: lactonase family protein [Verrucomicrobiales bacterium]|nr:lactonase family protein [Verrucomicrobiales bacterium]